jgi:hypothetical protein
MSSPVIVEPPVRAESRADAHANATRVRDSHADELAGPTFARRRLRLGISGVGGSVVASLTWLALLLTGTVNVAAWSSPFAALPAPIRAVADAVLLVLAVFAAHAALTFALEYRGGAVVVRQRPAAGAWLGAWTRGVLVQATLLGTLTAMSATAGVLFGVFGVITGVLAGSLLLLALQGPIAQLVASMPVTELAINDRAVRDVETADDAALTDDDIASLALAQGIRASAVRVVDAGDEAFVGGWIGLVKPTLWIPRAWARTTHRELLSVQFARRHAQFTSGARRRGVLRAALWPAFGVALFAPLLPWTTTEAAFWLALPAVSTIWMFVGVLLLPSLSRPIVYNADAVAAARLGRDVVAQAVRRLDAWQDDEPERAPGVEFIFHPVPSRGNRERALQRTPPRVHGGAHQLTRLSLYSALASGSLLGRVVHCNIGRPALWVAYPGD